MTVRRTSHSFANRLTFAYVSAATALALLIGAASTYFMFALYAETSNEIINSAAHSVERRERFFAAHRVPLAQAAPHLTADLERPRIRIAVYDQRHRLLSTRGQPLAPQGYIGAIASLMDLRAAQIPVEGGLIVVSADLGQLDRMLRGYWLLMLPLSLFVIAATWLAGWAITRVAVRPLADLATAMRRLAAGDLTFEPVRSAADDEIGEIAHAYNTAVYQVTSVLAERDRSEAQIRQFIADAGHELRTPLTVIMGYLDVVADGTVTDRDVLSRVFATMRAESRRMRTLIEKLIFLARLERAGPLQREIINVKDVVARVVAAADGLGGAAQRIDVHAAPNVTVLAEESDLFEAIRNLIDNALKYAPESRVDVVTDIVEDGVSITVRDRGPGMSERDRLHAFDRFYRGAVREGVDGSGLGLAIAQRAVVRAEGRITLDTAPGAGATFRIWLPRAESADGP